MDMKNIGENIRAIRMELKMSQVQLACKIGKVNTFLCDIEKGRVLPSFKKLISIAEALDIKPDVLLKCINITE